VNLGSTTIIWLKCALAQGVSPDFDTAEQLPRGLDRVVEAASWLVLKRMELRIRQKSPSVDLLLPAHRSTGTQQPSTVRVWTKSRDSK